MRPGEKLNEVLVSEYEATHTLMYDENYYIIMPAIAIKGLEAHYEKLKLEKVQFTRYASDDQVLGKENVKTLLIKSGFLA